VPTPTKPAAPAAPAAPPAPPTPDAPDPADELEPRDMLKAVVREVLDEFTAERAADPVRTSPTRDLFRDLLGIKS
jgi:hypothetical protein